MTLRGALLAVVLAALAIATQVVAIWLLAAVLAHRLALPVFFAAQTIAACVGAVCMMRLGPKPLRRPWWMGIAYNSTFIFFIPVGGQIMLFGMALLQRALPMPETLLEANEVGVPSFEPRLLNKVHQGSGSRAQAQATHTDINVNERMTAMAAIRNVSPHVTGKLLRDLLTDSHDEMRLFAYGILDQAEKHIMHDISKARSHLQKNPKAQQAAVDHARLAELHWELVYQGLAQGDMHQHMLELSASHAREALQLRPSLAGMHYLLGRHALLMHQPLCAQACFDEALHYGMASSRVAPWQAEALFLQGKPHEAAHQMQQVPGSGSNSQLQAAVRFWQ